MYVYDSIIIGQGPAGLSAAIYLARFNRAVLVLDNHYGRSVYPQKNENYLGFPHGIHARDLRDLGKEQAEKFGARFKETTVTHITKGSLFEVSTTEQVHRARSIILATGVTDLFPDFEHFRECVGISLFWCITCDGYRTRGKTIAVVGNSDEAAETAMQFFSYTPHVRFITNAPPEETKISPKWLKRFEDHVVLLYESEIAYVKEEKGKIRDIFLKDETKIRVDFVFSQQGAVPNNTLAKQLGLALDEHGYILTDINQKTNIPFVYAAGDITKNFAHQLITAAHEGSMAGQACNYDLYEPWQRE